MKDIVSYRFIHQLQALDFIDEIWLFGSRAREDHRPRSDIDLAIVCPRATHKNWLDVLDIIENADTLLKIDCIKIDKENMNPDLYKNILKDKRVIYDKDTHKI